MKKLSQEIINRIVYKDLSNLDLRKLNLNLVLEYKIEHFTNSVLSGSKFMIEDIEFWNKEWKKQEYQTLNISLKGCYFEFQKYLKKPLKLNANYKKFIW